MDRKLIISMIVIFAIGVLVGYAITSITNPPNGLYTTRGYLASKAYPCSDSICPTLIVYAIESDDGRTYYLTKNGTYCSSLEFDGLILEVEDYFEVTGVVYSKTVNQGLIHCIEWYSIIK